MPARARPVSNGQVAFVRAYLKGQLAKAFLLNLKVLLASLSSPFDPRLSRFLHAGFALAAVRRFSPTYNTGDVVRLVAAIRARRQHRQDRDIQPRLAETLILQAIGPSVPDPYDKWRKLHARFLLLPELVDELDLDDPGLDELLTEARELADRWGS